MSKPFPGIVARSASEPQTVVSAVVPAEPVERLAIVDRILADPPVVHPMEAAEQPRMGVWATEPSCYRFLAERCSPGTRTLETGSGLSTVLFAALGTDHICCTAGQEEADRVLEHCQTRGIPTDGVRFEVGSSHRTLPPLEASGAARDLVLIDGSHAFPLPAVDWFYGAALLGPGGVLVVDDLDAPGRARAGALPRRRPALGARGGLTEVAGLDAGPGAARSPRTGPSSPSTARRATGCWAPSGG